VTLIEFDYENIILNTISRICYNENKIHRRLENINNVYVKF